MENKDWLVTDQGICELCSIANNWQWTTKTYRLYRFLTDLEEILDDLKEPCQRLQKIRPLVRRLLTSSYWLQTEYVDPEEEMGWSVTMLYDEFDFPLTVQNVVWKPGQISPIHNHATWGIVAILDGVEKNILWRRNPTPKFPDKIEKVAEKTLYPGDIISFTPDAIHQVEAIGDQPTISFNLYGLTNYEKRFEFEIVNHTAKNF